MTCEHVPRATGVHVSSWITSKVVTRTLNKLGYRSGLSCSLNDPERINDMTSELKFVQSVEFVRHKEKEVVKLKAQKRKEK